MYTILNERALVRISGKDRAKFLQAIITNDITQLNENNAIYACLLTPQGKYFTDLFLKLDQDTILIDLPTARIEEILQKLKIYKLRSDVTFTEAPEYKIIASTETNHPNFFRDPRSTNLRWRGFVATSETKKFECDQNDISTVSWLSWLAWYKNKTVSIYTAIIKYIRSFAPIKKQSLSMND